MLLKGLPGGQEPGSVWDRCKFESCHGCPLCGLGQVAACLRASLVPVYIKELVIPPLQASCVHCPRQGLRSAWHSPPAHSRCSSNVHSHPREVWNPHLPPTASKARAIPWGHPDHHVDVPFLFLRPTLQGPLEMVASLEVQICGLLGDRSSSPSPWSSAMGAAVVLNLQGCCEMMQEQGNASAK